MIDADIARLRRQARRIARPRLYHVLHWATWHALRDSDTVGRLLSDERTIATATNAIHRVIDDLADRGAFLYFGISSSWDMGPLPIELRQVTEDGGIALEVEPVANVILDGGRRGAGWVRADELTITDLAR